MALGHLSGILASLALILGGCGFALFLLRKNFAKVVKEDLPKKKVKAKKVAAIKAAPQEVAQTVETRTEFSFELEPKAAPAEVSVPQLLAAAPTEAAPLQVQEMAPVPSSPMPEVPVDLSSAVHGGGDSLPQAQNSECRSCRVTSIHIAIWPYDRVLERLNPDHAYEALNEFHAIGAGWAKKNQVMYEKSSGGSFYLHWTQESNSESALRVALELRQEFMEWNDVRRAQGYLPFTVVMGADKGVALWGQIGPENDRKESVVGEVIARARALSQISLALGTNLLASDTLWASVSGRYLGEKVASATLTAFENLTSCYKVQGYYDEQGKEIWMRCSDHDLDPESCHVDAPRIEKNEPAKLWRVNNGSQILGPMIAKDVGRALYSLDLDFDCECWEEGGANRVTIEKSGMFGGVTEANAHFWVFDGDELHGPLTEEFLRTGMGKKEFPRDSYVCEKSTLNGWKPLMELRAWILAQSAPAEIVAPSTPIASPEPIAAVAEDAITAAPVFEAAPPVMLHEMETLEAPVLAAAEPVAMPVQLQELPVQESDEDEEPTASIDLEALRAARNSEPSEPSFAAALEPALEPALSMDPPAPPAPMLVDLAPAAPSAPTLAELMPAPPAPPMPLAFEAPEAPAAPLAPPAPVVELKPMTIEVAPPAPPAPPAPATAAQASEAPAAPAAPAIEMPILMPVLEPVASSRKSA